MGLFERYLTVWVALGIGAGVVLGLAMPGIFQAVASLELAHVNLVVAVLIWVMIYPMMIQIDWHAVKDVGQKPKGLMLTGACQGSCRLIYAAKGCLRSAFMWSATTESRSGLRVTAPIGDQSRVVPDQRAGLRSRALRYSSCRAARMA